MFKYRLYGLNLSSSRKINLLPETDFPSADFSVEWNVSTEQTPDQTINWKPVSTKFLDALSDVSIYQSDKFTKVVFRVNETRNLNFLLDAERKNLQIFHQEYELESDLESYFVGPVLSFVLRMRGIICLHSSVVGIDGKAAAFMGHATAGKSTIAAGMAEIGAEVLADDIAVLLPSSEDFMIQPGYSKIRLRPVAAEFLTENADNLPMVYSHRQSRYVSLDETQKFQPKPMPLAAIYVLGEIADEFKKPFIKPVRSNEKLINLLKNTSGNYAVMKNSRAEEFQILTQIAKKIPMQKLHYAHDIETLPEQCRLIASDFQQIIGVAE